MSEIEKLAELFTKFPGIGPRQARRFVYFLLRNSEAYRKDLTHAITHISDEVQQCRSCFCYAQIQGGQKLCSICADEGRATSELMVVEKDTDVDAMEKSGTYKGTYFILGGVLHLVGNKKQNLREKELLKRLKTDKDISEVILALSATPDGEYTADYLRTKLPDTLTITVLGRGLSTGSELEYADSETLRSALKNRS